LSRTTPRSRPASNVNRANDFTRALDPQLPTLDSPITANANINQDCNAFFDGKSVNFFHASMRCENTGRIQDVVFHEFGHSVHTAEIIPGVGAFDGAMSEGAADFFAVQITGDPGTGRGFFYTDEPLRALDSGKRWPQDIGEIHMTGMIFGGAFWDLRQALISALDETDGIALTQKLYIGALHRSTSIPTSLIEVSQPTPTTATSVTARPTSARSATPGAGTGCALPPARSRLRIGWRRPRSPPPCGSISATWRPGAPATRSTTPSCRGSRPPATSPRPAW
jgi:hypothetical protein